MNEIYVAIYVGNKVGEWLMVTLVLDARYHEGLMVGSKIVSS